MLADPPDSGALPSDCRIIEVRVQELRQLFNAIDPSPFHERDLDPKAEQFIVGWGRDLPADAPLALVAYVSRAGEGDEQALLRDAVHEYFAQRAQSARRELRMLFHRGRISLAIGLLFLTTSIVLGNIVVQSFPDSGFGAVLRESLLIGGWVAMWHPLEVFLYDWWPIRDDARLMERLSAMPVRIVRDTAVPEPRLRSD